MRERTYIALDLKSFYASVECRERNLDPMDTNLVVADKNRTDKTICLAVTPSLKKYGISGRGRLFEVRQKVQEVNALRRRAMPGGRMTGSSWQDSRLAADPSLEVDFLIAPPRMAYYMEYSTRIYQIYMKYVAPEDVIVYSIDEVFMDVTDYLELYHLSAWEFARKLILDVLHTTGITATAGIGTNLFLCKTAMDIVAKHLPADETGVRIACLDELEFRRTLWSHRPLTDFWRIGKGYAAKLEEKGLFTMGDIARCSLKNETLLYQLFGKNAELLIDHAWGWEPCTVKAVKAYQPENRSLGSGQVLTHPYTGEKALLVVKEMAESLALSLADKGLVTDQIVLTVGYDMENLADPVKRKNYKGLVTLDRYGRKIPKQAHGSVNLLEYSSSSKEIVRETTRLFDEIVNKELLIRRLNISANHVVLETHAKKNKQVYEQMNLFTDYALLEEQEKQRQAEYEREKKLQRTMLDIKKKFGKNAILKGMSLEEGATAIERNKQIGGHRA